MEVNGVLQVVLSWNWSQISGPAPAHMVCGCIRVVFVLLLILPTAFLTALRCRISISGSMVLVGYDAKKGS